MSCSLPRKRGRVGEGAIPSIQIARARALRQQMTPPERWLWQALRAQRLGVKFRRQHPIGHYVADFACIEARLVIEVDGWTHAAPGSDMRRDAALHAAGWRVLRFWNNEVMDNRDGVLEVIRAALPPPTAVEPPP